MFKGIICVLKNYCHGLEMYTGIQQTSNFCLCNLMLCYPLNVTIQLSYSCANQLVTYSYYSQSLTYFSILFTCFRDTWRGGGVLRNIHLPNSNSMISLAIYRIFITSISKSSLVCFTFLLNGVEDKL